MDINRVSIRPNDPNISSAAAVSSLRDKVKRARPSDEESKRRLALIFSGEDDEENDKDDNNK